MNHVYERLGRSEQIFDQEAAATGFVNLLRHVVTRDDMTRRRNSVTGTFV